MSWSGSSLPLTTDTIAIRTVTVEDDLAVFHAGWGVTAISDPETEYEETLAKARRIFDAFGAEIPGEF